MCREMGIERDKEERENFNLHEIFVWLCMHFCISHMTRSCFHCPVSIVLGESRETPADLHSHLHLVILHPKNLTSWHPIHSPTSYYSSSLTLFPLPSFAGFIVTSILIVLFWLDFCLYFQHKFYCLSCQALKIMMFLQGLPLHLQPSDQPHYLFFKFLDECCRVQLEDTIWLQK